MRKKFFAMYALVGALVASPVFTSCVDDSESASVTAIRNAKAEQLKASAAYDLARTEYEKALTAYKEAELAAKLAETEQDKALFEYQLATAKALYEKTALQYEQEKLNYLKTMATTENQMITTAASNYTGALDRINELNKDLFDAKVNLAEIGIDSAKNVAIYEAYVAKQNKIIADATVNIERIKAYKGETKASLDEKKAAVVANYKSLKNEKALADAAKTKADNAVSEAGNAYNAVAYANVVSDLIAAPYNMTITPTNFNSATGLNSYVESYSALLESEILTNKQTLKQTLATEKATLGAPKTDAAAATGLYVQLETLETALKDAQDDLAANTDATLTAGLETAVEDAQIDVAEYKEQTLQPQLDVVKDAEDAIAEFDALVAAFAEGSDEYKEWAAAQEALVAAKKAAKEADDKATELNDAITATGISSIDTDGNVTAAATGEYAILNALYSEEIDAATLIAELEAEIAGAKAAIERGAAVVEGHWIETSIQYSSGGSTTWTTGYAWITEEVYSLDTDTLKALAEAEIEAIEAEIAVQKQLLAKYKAELDALLTAEA